MTSDLACLPVLERHLGGNSAHGGASGTILHKVTDSLLTIQTSLPSAGPLASEDNVASCEGWHALAAFLSDVCSRLGMGGPGCRGKRVEGEGEGECRHTGSGRGDSPRAQKGAAKV